MKKERILDDKKVNADIMEEEYVLIILSDDRPLYFENCEIYSKGRKWNLKGFPHVGFSTDSIVLDSELWDVAGMPNVDLRYFARQDNLLEFYVWAGDIEHVFIKNAGGGALTIDTGCDVYILNPSELPYKITPDAFDLE